MKMSPAPAKHKYTKKSTTTTTETPAENPVVIESTTKPEPKKRGPKKVQTDTPQHIKNFNPTQMKKIKEAGAEEKVNEFKDYLNSLTEEGFKSKKIPDHLQDFLNPKEEESLAELPGCIDVDYEIDGEMKPYAVNPATKCVYEKQGEVYVKVGMVGALQFAEMEI